jgi:hypothetical protein
LLSFSLHSRFFFGLLLGVFFIVLGVFLSHGESESDLGIIGHRLTSTVLVLVEEHGSGTETDSIVRLELNARHIGQANSVNEDLFHSLGGERNEHSGVSRGLESGVIDLNTDTTEFNWRSLSSLLATNLGFGGLRQIEEDLSVEDTIFIQVHDLRSTGGTSLFLLLLGFVFLLSEQFSFGKLLLPRLVELIKLGLVSFDITSSATTASRLL